MRTVAVSVGQRWKAARLAAGLSADDAAKFAGCSRNTIYDLEKDDDGVTLRMMRRVAAVYGVALSEIFEETERPERVPSEFRPLLEFLMPLTKQKREDVVRNIAANLSFVTSTFGSLSTNTSDSQSDTSDNKYRDGNNPRVPSSPSEIVGRALLGVSEEDEESQGNATGADAGRETDDKRTAKRR